MRLTDQGCYVSTNDLNKMGIISTSVTVKTVPKPNSPNAVKVSVIGQRGVKSTTAYLDRDDLYKKINLVLNKDGNATIKRQIKKVFDSVIDTKSKQKESIDLTSLIQEIKKKALNKGIKSNQTNPIRGRGNTQSRDPQKLASYLRSLAAAQKRKEQGNKGAGNVPSKSQSNRLTKPVKQQKTLPVVNKKVSVRNRLLEVD